MPQGLKSRSDIGNRHEMQKMELELTMVEQKFIGSETNRISEMVIASQQ